MKVLLSSSWKRSEFGRCIKSCLLNKAGMAGGRLGARSRRCTLQFEPYRPHVRSARASIKCFSTQPRSEAARIRNGLELRTWVKQRETFGLPTLECHETQSSKVGTL